MRAVIRLLLMNKNKNWIYKKREEEKSVDSLSSVRIIFVFNIFFGWRGKLMLESNSPGVDTEMEFRTQDAYEGSMTVKGKGIKKDWIEGEV